MATHRSVLLRRPSTDDTDDSGSDSDTASFRARYVDASSTGPSRAPAAVPSSSIAAPPSSAAAVPSSLTAPSTSAPPSVSVPVPVFVVRDSIYAPKPFTGHQKGATAESWLDYFQSYTEYSSLPVVEQLRLFKLLMSDAAAAWLRSLPEPTKASLDVLLTAFRQRFAITDVHRWQQAADMWSRQQQSTETVDEFASDIINMAKRVPVNDAQLLRFAIIKGLKPDIRLHVLQSAAATVEDVLKAARIAEAALAVTAPSSDVASLTHQVSELLSALKTSALQSPPSVHALQQQQQQQESSSFHPRSPSPRRVHFRDDYDAARRRSPSSRRRPAAQFYQAAVDRSPSPSHRRYDHQVFRDYDQPRDVDHRPSYEPVPAPIIDQSVPMMPPSWTVPPPFIQPATPLPQWTATPRPPLHHLQQTTQQTSSTCRNCGMSHGPRQCTAYGKQCYNCAKFHHFSRCCFSKRCSPATPPYFGRTPQFQH